MHLQANLKKIAEKLKKITQANATISGLRFLSSLSLSNFSCKKKINIFLIYFLSGNIALLKIFSFFIIIIIFFAYFILFSPFYWIDLSAKLRYQLKVIQNHRNFFIIAFMEFIFSWFTF